MIENKKDDNIKKHSDDNSKAAYFCVVLSAILWGIIGIFVKKLDEYGFSNIQIVFIRAFVATVSVALYILIKNNKIEAIELKDAKYFVGTGILSFAFFNWCFFIAINKTSLAVAAILLYTAPTIVMIFSVFLFKEKMTKNKAASLLLTFAGCVLVTFSAQATGIKVSFVGVLAGLGSGLGYGLYSIFSRYALEKYDSMTVTLYTFIFASLSLIPAINLPQMVSLFSNLNSVFYAVTLGVLSTTMPFLLYTYGLTQIQSSKASIIATLEPIVATVVGIVLYSEGITILKILGIIIVVLGLAAMRNPQNE